MPRGSAKKQPSKASKKKAQRAAERPSGTVPQPLASPSRPTSASPGPSSASAIRLPQKPREDAYYRSAAIFAFGIMVLAGLLFATVREINLDRTPPPPVEVDDPLFEELRNRPEFRDWVSKWRAVDPYVSYSEFTLERKSALEPVSTAGTAYVPDAADLQPPV